MPKSTAIVASEKNIDKILNRLSYDTTEKFVKMTIADAQELGTTHYFVTDVFWLIKFVPFLVYSHETFLDEFASIPPGIEDNFVPVTQVKDGP